MYHCSPTQPPDTNPDSAQLKLHKPTTYTLVYTMCVCRVALPLQELRQDAELQEGNLGWLRTRMAALIEVCSDSDGQRHGGALGKLSVDFKGLLASLAEVRGRGGRGWTLTFDLPAHS